VTFVLLSVIVNDPENDDPDWVSCHVMVPGPDESLAVPDHVPLMLAGDEGSVGVEPPPPQAVAAASAKAASVPAERRRVHGSDEMFIGRMN
jgi:hypothetical protein